jgi:hypothetical protein
VDEKEVGGAWLLSLWDDSFNKLLPFYGDRESFHLVSNLISLVLLTQAY